MSCACCSSTCCDQNVSEQRFQNRFASTFSLPLAYLFFSPHAESTLRAPTDEKGVIVDGFPRTRTQAECIKLLFETMQQLRRKYEE